MPDLIKFEDTVSYRLARVTTAFKTSLEKCMGHIGLHGGQIFLLMELWNQDGLRQRDLAERLAIAAPTVNKMVNGLVRIGLVTSSRLEDDARSTRIFLTKAGREIRSEIERQWVDLEESSLAGLTETERLILHDLLGKLKSTYTGRPQETDEDE
jgi:MarR family transcriptional regulator, organic hydroperoxide resistance regulator